MKNFIIIILILVNTVEASFEYIANPRVSGVADAYVAIAESIYGIHNNPASIAKLKKKELAFTYVRLFSGMPEDRLYQFSAGFGLPIGKLFNVGLNISRLVLQDVYDEGITSISVGKKFSKYLYAGVNLNILYRNYSLAGISENPYFATYGNKPSGFGIDVGFLIKISKPLLLGVALENLNEPNVALSGEDKVNRFLRLGVSYRIPASINKYNFISLEIVTYPFEFKIGAEYPLFGKEFVLRAGYAFGSDGFGRFGFGFGSNISIGKTFEIEAGYTFQRLSVMIIPESIGDHIIGCTIRF